MDTHSDLPLPESTHRRGFLGASAAALTALSAASQASATQGDLAAILPKRPLGKTGVEISMLESGTGRSSGIDRLLRFAYALGIRTFDTAKVYGSEPGFKRWFESRPEVRKEIFLVTKDDPRQPSDLERMADERLRALGTETIDLFFIHGLGDHSEQAGREWPRSPEWARAVEKLKNSGKIRFFGFASHHRNRAEFLQSAAQGGYIDAIMVMYTPWLDKESPLNKALDACHAKGIGLISMKQFAGQFSSREGAGGIAFPEGAGEVPVPEGVGKAPLIDEVKRRVPALAERNLMPYQGLLHAIWSDERIASACVSMLNTEQMRENTDAARRYAGPLEEAQIRQLRDVSLAFGPTLCADCDGRCSRAAGTTARLGDLTRYLTYYEHHGSRSEARRLYSELAPEERNWSDADLAAARKACPNGLDFARLLPRADEHLA